MGSTERNDSKLVLMCTYSHGVEMNGCAIDLSRYMQEKGLIRDKHYVILPIAGFSNDLSGRSLLKLCDEVLLKIPLSNKLGLPYGVIGGYQQIHEYLKRDMRTIKSELTRQREE